MKPFKSEFRGPTWVAPVAVLALLIGVLIPFASRTQTQNQGRLRELTPDQRQLLAEGKLDMTEDFKRLQEDVAKLREDNTKLQQALAAEDSQGEVLNDSLQDLKQFAGLTEVEGPGITIILSDSKNRQDDAFFASPDSIIHDIDVLKVVNELWNAGAEAISVNNIRVGISSDFRCVGTTILVDSVKIAAPVTIRAIGEKSTLKGALEMPGGIVDELRMIDPEMVQIELVELHILPAYAGPTTQRHVKPRQSEANQ